jgi:hypothetical protein
VWCVQLNVPKIEDGNNFGARAHGCALDSHRDESSVAAATSAPGPGLGSPCHICTGTGLPLPHLHRDCAPPLEDFGRGPRGTRPTPHATSALGLGSPPLPHLHRAAHYRGVFGQSRLDSSPPVFW